MRAALVLLPVLFAACGGGGSGGQVPPPVSLPDGPVVTIEAGIKQLIFNWEAVPGATYYRLLENPDGSSGFTQVGDDIPSGTLTVIHSIAVHLLDWANAEYVVEACNSGGCSSSAWVNPVESMAASVGYFKASNTDWRDEFGISLALSADGTTLAVGADGERSLSTGINGDQYDDQLPGINPHGAVYIFRFDGADWAQEAYVKPSISGVHGSFGRSIAISSDGNTLAVGSPFYDGGCVYVFRFDGSQWYEESRVFSSYTEWPDRFGYDVALSGTGELMAVGAPAEQSAATGINGNQHDNSLNDSGAVYIFRHDGQDWLQQAYIKASNSGFDDWFGISVALSKDGNLLAVGAPREDSGAGGVNAEQIDDSAPWAGAVYIFRYHSAAWNQQSYIKASNPDSNDYFGHDVALSNDGNTLAAGAPHEGGASTGIDGDQSDNSAMNSGATYIFQYDGDSWYQQAYVKASNTGLGDKFGSTVALSSNGNSLAVGAISEASTAVGIDGDQTDDSWPSGAVYWLATDGDNWAQEAYIKQPYVRDLYFTWVSHFGAALALAADGRTLAIGSWRENSAATGINGDPSSLLEYGSGSNESGAAYLY